MTSIYDRPVRELIREAFAEMPDLFISQDIVRWFRQHYERVPQKTVRSNLRCACVNTPEGKRAGWPPEERTVYRVARGQFTRYRPDVHGECVS